MSEAPSAATERTDTRSLGLSMTRVLSSPLAALRASIESLSAEIGHEDPGGRMLEGALQQVTRMARDLQSLVELAAPRAVASLRCSVDEIALAALRVLPAAERERVRLARPAAGTVLVIDGPLLSACLARLLHGALESAGESVLLQVRRQSRRTLFVIVQEDARAGFDPVCVDLVSPGPHASLAVHLAVAQRDLERLGGRLEVQHTERGLTCVTVALDSNPARPGNRAESKR